MKKIVITGVTLFIILLTVILFLLLKSQQRENIVQKPIQGTTPTSKNIQVLAENLSVPWEVIVLQDGSFIASEREGKLTLLDPKKKIVQTLELPITVHAQGEGGLLGIAIDPEFTKNKFLYSYYTYQENSNTWNRVARFILEGSTLKFDKVLLDNIPAAGLHNGGRIAFGPDTYLYVTTGDAQKPEQAQDIDSLAGKILRITRDGTPAPDNPFSNTVYSFGHRNPQGLAWDNQQRLWATEHGPSAHDELNVIKAGANYGWPIIIGQQTKEGMELPVLESGNETWAPGGIVIADNRAIFGGLRGHGLFVVNLDQIEKPQEYFSSEFGRVRSITTMPNGDFLILTSNRDGRGIAKNSDDKVIQISRGLLIN